MYAKFPSMFVGVDAHIDPAGRTRLFRKSLANLLVPLGRCRHRPLRIGFGISVWANAHVGPAEQSDNTVIPGEFVRTQWGDVGIDPYALAVIE